MTTIKQTLATIRALGLTASRTEHREFRVNFKGAGEGSAYYTSDADDAIATAHAMAGRLTHVTGYDGSTIAVGSRVELHPACDLWMRGAKYGNVTALSHTSGDKVRLQLDALPGRTYSCPASLVRGVS